METPVEMQQTCPYCKGPLKPGWVEAWARWWGIRWHSFGGPVSFLGERLSRWTWPGISTLPAYRCDNCRTVILRY